jgi:hypothetical protein
MSKIDTNVPTRATVESLIVLPLQIQSGTWPVVANPLRRYRKLDWPYQTFYSTLPLANGSRFGLSSIGSKMICVDTAGDLEVCGVVSVITVQRLSLWQTT